MISASRVHAQQGSESVVAAAQKAFDKGVQELDGGNHAGAISLLKTAVRIQPDNAKFQNQLAKAFLEAKRHHEMWVHLRKATVLDLGNEQYARDFLHVWMYHDREGMLNVGTSGETLLAGLGEPDKRIENGKMKRWVYGFMAVDFGTSNDGTSGLFRVLDLRGYTADADLEVEQVSVKTDPKKWKVAHHQVSRTNDNLELTLKSEEIQNWSELFSKQRFPMMSQTGGSVEGMVDAMHQSLKATDPNVEFTILAKSPDAIVYHWMTHATDDHPPQHEVAKIIKGQKDFYRVAYVKKTDRLGDSEFKHWCKVIGEARLIPMQTENTEVAPANSKIQAWEFGKNLSFAALLRGKHGPEEAVKKTLLAVSRNAQALGVAVPPPGPLTDDVAGDTAAAIAFLLNTAGKPIYNALQEKFGDVEPALFELATKSTLLSMLYEPGDATSKSFAEAIERAATQAGLDREVWKPLVDLVNSKATQDNVREEIKILRGRVSQALEK